MKGIILNAKNMDKIAAEIKHAEGKSTARTITAGEIKTTCEKIEKNLKITKKALNGTSVVVDICAQSFPHAYKFVPESTHFKAAYKNGAWRITNIYRAACSYPEVHLTLTESAKIAIFESKQTIRAL